jgi:large subunit ribosomal protein L24
MKVHKGDTVLVISGKDKGAKGKVLVAYPDRDKVLVEGVNRIKKHTPVSRTERGASSGGIVTQEAPIHVSNVMPVVETDGKKVGTRVGTRVDDDGTKTRVARRTGEDIR